MGRFDTIKQTIDANIKQNGNQGITGQIMNSVLNGMVGSVDDAMTAEAAETEAKLDELSADVGGLTLSSFGKAGQWKLGALSADGDEESSTNRAISPFLQTSNFPSIRIKEGFNLSFRYYDNDRNGVSVPLEWKSGDVVINTSYPYFRMQARYADDRAIDISLFCQEKLIESIDDHFKSMDTMISEANKGLIYLGVNTIPLALGMVGMDGNEMTSTTRAMSGLLKNNTLYFDKTLKVVCRYFDAQGNFLKSDQEWHSGGEYQPNSQYDYMRVVVSYIDDSVINDVSDLHVSFKSIINAIERVEYTQDSMRCLSAKAMQYKAESNGVIKTYSLKSVKQSNAVRGRSPMPIAWLYIDNDTEDMYLVKTTPFGEMQHIGIWDKSVTWNGQASSKEYSIFITPEDDLICVFRTEMLYNGVVGRDSDRKNPIVYKHDDYSHPIVVDFGEDTPPSAWLMSCGADYDYQNNFFCFAEYGRVNLTYSNVWKVLPPYDSKEKWSISHRWATSGLEDKGFKHCHCCEIDPYTGIVYVATGDDESAAAIYASSDNGTSYTKVAGTNEMKCRLLNFIFTKEYIWWASDSYEAKHALFRAKRVDGVISESTIELVAQIPFSKTASLQATYITYYAEDRNMLLFLDYYDASGYAEPMQIYGYDINAEKIVKLKLLHGVTDKVHKVGFRCECSSFYQGMVNKGVTLGWQWVANENLLLNNTLDNQLRNVEIEIE